MAYYRTAQQLETAIKEKDKQEERYVPSCLGK